MDERYDDRDRYDAGTNLPERNAPRRGAPLGDGPLHETPVDDATMRARPLRTPRMMATPTHRPNRAGWLIPLALLLLVAFGVSRFIGRRGNDTVATNTSADTMATTTSTSGGDVAATSAAGAAVPVAQLMTSPHKWEGKTVSVSGTVAEVVSDRGFWIDDQGQRIFVVLGEKGAGTNAAEHAVDVKTGEQVTLTNAHVFTNVSQVPGGHVEEKARGIIKGQRAFLHAMPDGVQHGS